MSYVHYISTNQYGIAIGYYIDCDTAVCTDDIPAASEWAAGNYVGWAGFEGWESPAAIFMDSESDSVTHCATCGRVIRHDLTPDGYASITEALERALDGNPGAAIAQWMDAYGDDVDLPDSYLDAFLGQYAQTMLWANTREESDTEGSGETYPVPSEGLSAFDSTSQDSMREDCAGFIRENWADLAGIDAGQAGHDFALTRNRHGAGFWDRGLGDRGERLTKASHAYGESSATFSADGGDVTLA